MRRSRPVRHTDLFWCDGCNVPLMGRTCGKCGQAGRIVELAPPGDVRLALDGTKRRLRYLFLRQFGVQQLIPDVTVLNKSSGEDRADEVIVDGRRVALLTYDLERQDFSLTLRIDGARMLAHTNPKKLIMLNKTEGHMKGAYIPPESIRSFDHSIRAGDEVVIVRGKFIGCGSAKVNAPELGSSRKGVKVRDFAQAEPLRPGKRAFTKDVVKANMPHLIAKKAKAEQELKKVLAERRLPVTMSFSGGKDSLVALDLLSSVTEDFKAIFIDTGLEHPQTVDYVERFMKKRGVPLLTARAGEAFDENFPAFGPPAKDFRWCCKVCKLAPVTDVIAGNFPGGTLTVEGNRRLESFARGATELVEENPFVPGQIIVNPIRDWTALDVWLYIVWRGLEYNPLYNDDIERVGCWMCPSSLASETADIARLSPELSKAWQGRLDTWAEENDLPRGFVKYGFWRWKELPPKMRDLAKRLNLEVRPMRADTLSIDMMKGVSPCAAGGYSVEAVLRIPEDRGLRKVAEILKTVGRTRLVEDFGVAMVDRKNASAKIFAGGQISAVGKTREEAIRVFNDVARAVLRANMCTSCGICVRTCHTKAIRLDGGIRVDHQTCDSCGKCAESCVAAHYFDKLADRASAREDTVKKGRPRRATSPLP